MRQYIIRRLLLFFPTALLVAALLFSLTRIVPGDAIDQLIEQDSSRQFTSAERAQLMAQLGLDQPLPKQFLKWVWGAFRFDFGTSFWEHRPNMEIIKERWPRTFELALLGLLVGVTWGVTSGVISAVKQDTWIDGVVRVITVGGLALPSFFLAVMLFYALILAFNWIPPVRYYNLWENPTQNLQQVMAPVLLLGYSSGAGISRLTRSQFLEVFREDYIRTARAKGLQENIIIVRHALRNSLLPVVTVAGLLFAGLLGGVVIVETVFAIPGMGRQLVHAVNVRDYPLLQSLVWILSINFMASNLVVDVAYAWIDPRIRYR